MADTKFTPGPWRIANNGRSGKKTRTFRIWRNDPNQPDGDNFRNTGYANISSHVSGEANAHLIAAAPQLYEALECLLNATMYRNHPEESQMAINALTKARGDI